LGGPSDAAKDLHFLGCMLSHQVSNSQCFEGSSAFLVQGQAVQEEWSIFSGLQNP